MRNKKNSQESEVYILGANAEGKKNKISPSLKWFIAFVCIALVSVCIFLLSRPQEETVEYYFEPEELSSQSTTVVTDQTSEKEYVEVLNDTINDVTLQIYVPHNASMSLVIGMPDKQDSTIIFAAMAADIRKDNEEIVGDFVLAGQRISKGAAKKGFCAVIDDTITIGTHDDTPLLDEAIDKKGYFFRQYSLVMDGEVIENKPKNKSIRRAIGVRANKVMMVESLNKESFHDFSQALADVGFSDAIYLVGGNAYGWYYDHQQILTEFGKKEFDFPQNISYIVWKTK